MNKVKIELEMDVRYLRVLLSALDLYSRGEGNSFAKFI